MRSRLIINLLLIAVITVMAITLSLTDNNKSVETDTLLTSLSPDSVSSISILLEGEERSIFKRENDHWMMQKPYVHAANPVRINSMLNLLSAYSYARFDLEGLELSRFDLDSPRMSLVFNNTRIDFGSENPLDKTRYVMTGQQIHLINDSLFQQLQAPATFFLDTQLLPPGTIITGLSYPEHQVTQVDQRWMVIPEMEAETQPIEDLISAWQTVNAITLQPYIPREEVEETITVAREQFGNIIFDIVSPFPKLILGRADIGIQYHVSQENAGHLFLQPVDNNVSSTDETPAMEQPGQ